MDFIEPCFGIGHNLSLICQMTSEDIKHQLIIICAEVAGKACRLHDGDVPLRANDRLTSHTYKVSVSRLIASKMPEQNTQ